MFADFTNPAPCTNQYIEAEAAAKKTKHVLSEQQVYQVPLYATSSVGGIDVLGGVPRPFYKHLYTETGEGGEASEEVQELDDDWQDGGAHVTGTRKHRHDQHSRMWQDSVELLTVSQTVTRGSHYNCVVVLSIWVTLTTV